MTETLTHADIRDLLRGFGAAIELDQLRVDAVPAERFHPLYDDGMWRGWRTGHIGYIDKLLTSVETIPSAMLTELTRIAINYEPKAIGHVVLELFAEAVSGGCPEEELATAERLFSWLIRQVGERSKGGSGSQGARDSILQWMAVADPLRIAHDPECGYGQPTGSVS
jgi:hypothetical protein